jgi:Asp/Glu/hydantoin racemase
MPKRVFLVHPTPLAMAPIDEAFKTLWPQAQTINVLDESLYADIPQDGTLAPAIYDRVDKARAGMRVPVLRAEEAMMEQAVTLGERMLLVCTAKRAMPVVRGTLDAAVKRAGVTRAITELWVKGARDAITSGDVTTHDRLIAEQVMAAGDFDVIIFGQISMVPAQVPLPPEITRRIVIGPQATVVRMRALIEH